MSISQSQRTIAIFGATGGTGLATLKFCLSYGHHVNVLVRTPSKLQTLADQYLTTLHLTQGDIRSITSLKKVLTSQTGAVVDTIISGIGMALKGIFMTSTDPTICFDGTRAILSSLNELEAEGKMEREPRIVLLSGTGITEKQRDIPLAMIPLYHGLLCVAHKDKREMENLIMFGDGKGRKWVLVRPSLLVNGEAKGLGAVRVSSERPEEKGSEKESTAIGYTIRREDVGLWIAEECVKSEAGEEWEGKMVTLTY
ncbi:hypothetical protein G7Y89_g14695 [Cudoniella acicularis]|uniref:NAD(P)-binding domain-containing protein n=1 Tax=Cudoniella acicularis TaxID=354080 RepID=A0A8H4VS65_9HELO|nr:hypothetical protein G7Y89_g14695 [Cudoniella acicularis]